MTSNMCGNWTRTFRILALRGAILNVVSLLSVTYCKVLIFKGGLIFFVVVVELLLQITKIKSVVTTDKCLNYKIKHSEIFQIYVIKQKNNHLIIDTGPYVTNQIAFSYVLNVLISIKPSPHLLSCVCISRIFGDGGSC